MQSWVKRWAAFLSIITDPWTVVSVAGAIIMLLWGGSTTDQTAKAIATVMISVASAIAGARIWQQWIEVTDSKILLNRGKSSIRSLSLLLKSIAALQSRVGIYMSRVASRDSHDEIIATYLEEIFDKCNSLQEDVVHSIENWTDIVPEASVAKSQIGVISDLKSQLRSQEADVKRLQAELDETRGQNDDITQSMTDELKKAEAESRRLRKELEKQKRELGSSILGGLPDSGSFLIGDTSKYGFIATDPEISSLLQSDESGRITLFDPDRLSDYTRFKLHTGSDISAGLAGGKDKDDGDPDKSI